MLFLKIMLLVASTIIFIMSVLILIFKKDYVLPMYKEHLKEGMITGNYMRCIGFICFIFSLAFMAIYICSLIPKINMSLVVFLWLSLGSTMLFLFTMGSFILVRALFMKHE